mmetsp:Transcript_9230/g.37967  ORF Transcript_9230/g.37967 Transcript_9230/m.37967 type:complete len:404 (-) Transcript_9230:32-1243(-)|eukprot:CAMPEP_0114627852 /NCGR_PEP_ID=MMETSP0168-20121206/12514_1 /TAXON_ID=95228 ORGANISM="Vannella sp., Strain DIVA3 517/6/12" /NCGR_SAMPLE_ID=MMETSP0168 /ASSEMBLY_ACC=CAM_ASM_000044 /LENGTH=403 /DNA_ID=CAMNT_0001839207 /DNA_START=77 /DNA_END=1288 /DNA_ORIENTATION=+
MAFATQLIAEAAQQYDVFYGRYLSNHIVHGLVALEGMGASKERLRAFYRFYEQHSTNGNMLEERKKARFSVTAENWREYEGVQENFPEFFEYYLQRVRAGELADILEELAPLIADRAPSYALHSFIHLGMALRLHDEPGADASIALAEGLALMVVSHVKVSNIGNAVKSEMEIGQLLDTVPVVSSMPELEAIYCDKEYRKGNFNEAFAYLEGKIGQAMLGHVEKWLAHEESQYAGDAAGLQQSLLRQLCRFVLAAHWGMGCLDFFLLHGVTAFFALLQLVKHLEKDEHRLLAIKQFTVTLLLTYIGVGAPVPRPLTELPTEEPMVWKDIWALVTSEDSDKNDEHMIKLAFVCKELEDLFEADADKRLASVTAQVGTQLPFHKTADYTFNTGLLQRGVRQCWGR